MCHQYQLLLVLQKRKSLAPYGHPGARRRASPHGGISARCARGFAGQAALRTTNWWDFFAALGAAQHRWHTGSADHQQVELMEPMLHGGSKFWGNFVPQGSKILGESCPDTAHPRFLLNGTQSRQAAPREDSQPPSSHDLPVDQLSEISSYDVFPQFTIFGGFLGWYCYLLLHASGCLGCVLMMHA